MTDWQAIYTERAAPALDHFQRRPPVPVIAVLVVACVAAVVAAVFGPMWLKLASLVVLFACGFVVYMAVTRGRQAVHGITICVQGTVVDKEVIHSTTTDSRGMSQPTTTHRLTVDVGEVRELSDTGLGAVVEGETGSRQFVVPEPLYVAVEKGEQVHGVVLPTAERAFRLVVTADAGVVEA